MRLKSFHVRVFRNVIDSGEIPVEDVTNFVGKNEAGKSALLQALHHLNPAKPAVSLDILDEYPRWLKKEHEISGEIADAVPITATFHLEQSEIDDLETRFGKGILTSAEVVVSRPYGSAAFKLDAPIAYRVFVEPFVAGLSERLQAAVGAVSNSTELRSGLTELAKATSGAESKPTAVASDALAAIEKLDEKLGAGTSLITAIDLRLRGAVPRTFYFSTYSQLSGRYSSWATSSLLPARGCFWYRSTGSWA